MIACPETFSLSSGQHRLQWIAQVCTEVQLSVSSLSAVKLKCDKLALEGIQQNLA